MNLIFHHDVPFEVQRLLLVEPVLSSTTFTVIASMLLLYCCRSTAGKAVGAVDVPESVIDVLTSLRDYLQDKCEPPIYVSDRRFMKALNLLQVAAYADGRDEVSIALRMHAVAMLCCMLAATTMQAFVTYRNAALLQNSADTFACMCCMLLVVSRQGLEEGGLPGIADMHLRPVGLVSN